MLILRYIKNITLFEAILKVKKFYQPSSFQICGNGDKNRKNCREEIHKK